MTADSLNSALKSGARLLVQPHRPGPIPENRGGKGCAGEGGNRAPVVRILQLTEAWGGMEHNNTQLAVRLAERGIRVKITAIGKAAYSQMPKRYAERLEAPEEIAWPTERSPSFREWYRLMRQHPADIVVIPKNWWAKGGLGMIAAAGLVYDRVVLREHVPVPGGPELPPKRYLGFIPSPRLWYYRQFLYGRLLSAPADRIICVSSRVRDGLVRQCGFKAEKTVVVNNGADCALFRFDPEARTRYRSTLGIPEEAVVCGAVARIENAVKRHDLSLRCFARLSVENPDTPLHFLLVGTGPDVGAIERLAHELKIEHRVSIAPFTSEPWQAYSALDLFLLPSLFEGFSLAIIEAMACECCAIATEVSGIGDVLDRPELGWRVGVDDPEGFYDAMREALRMGPLARREMGVRARESIVRRFDAVQQYERIIAHVLGEQPAS